MRKGKDWLARLVRSARWRLGAEEAGEVIADYREIVGDPPRSNEELFRDLGKPADAVKPLTDRRVYRVWLAVFAALAVCIWLPGTSPLPGGFYMLYFWCFDWSNLGRAAALLGAAGAIVWFRWKGAKEERLPRAVPVLLAVLLAWLIMVLAANWAWMHDPVGFWEMWGQTPVYVLWIRIGPPGYTVSRSADILAEALEWGGGLGMAVIGVTALVKARTRDRRWAAVYVLAFAAMVVSLESLALLTNMRLENVPTWAQFFAPRFCAHIVIGGVGLAGTGAALC